MRDYFKRGYGKKLGVGGWKCSCCGPRRGEKPKWRRRVRRKDKQQVRALVYRIYD